MLLVVSCSSDEGEITPAAELTEFGRDANYKAGFEASFPDATDVVWTTEGDYNVVSFKTASSARSTTVKAKAYYSDVNINYLTEEYISTSDVPSKYTDMAAQRHSDYDEDGYSSVTLIDATIGTCKGEMFYKLLYQAPFKGSTNDGVTWLYVYSGDREVNFWEYDYDDTDLAKTEIPELFAMEYIEKYYDSYILTMSPEYYSTDYVVYVAHSDSNGGEMTFEDSETDNVYDEQDYSYSNFSNTAVKAAVDTELEGTFSGYEVEWVLAYYENRVFECYDVLFEKNSGDGIDSEWVSYNADGTIYQPASSGGDGTLM